MHCKFKVTNLCSSKLSKVMQDLCLLIDSHNELYQFTRKNRGACLNDVQFRWRIACLDCAIASLRPVHFLASNK